MKKILLIDDQAINIKMLKQLLKEYDCVGTSDGKEGVKLAQEHEFDLVLLDIVMPYFDGFEVCKELQAHHKTKDIPIIFITASQDIGHLKLAFECGGVDFVTKPFNVLELLSRIKTHLELSGYKKELQYRVSQEVEKNRLKEKILLQQSKQAEIGELMMHIAHQWKQPLSEIGSINVLNMSKLATQRFDSMELMEQFKKIDEILKFMSNTMESFQNFYTPNDKKEYLDLHKVLIEAVKIVDATFDYHNIKLRIEQNTNPVVYINQNEIAQAILNILTNAKEALLEHKIQKPQITINVSPKENSQVSIEFFDNAGGVSEDMIDTLFEPFKSTKKSSGIGLYMARMLVEKNGASIGYDKEKKCFGIYFNKGIQ